MRTKIHILTWGFSTALWANLIRKQNDTNIKDTGLSSFDRIINTWELRNTPWYLFITHALCASSFIFPNLLHDTQFGKKFLALYKVDECKPVRWVLCFGVALNYYHMFSERGCWKVKFVHAVNCISISQVQNADALQQFLRQASKNNLCLTKSAIKYEWGNGLEWL